MDFWRELCEAAPSLTFLDSVGAEYERCTRGAENGYLTVLRMDRNSIGVLRGYARFLIEVRLLSLSLPVTLGNL